MTGVGKFAGMSKVVQFVPSETQALTRSRVAGRLTPVHARREGAMRIGNEHLQSVWRTTCYRVLYRPGGLREHLLSREDLLILIGLELMNTVKVYLEDHTVHVEAILGSHRSHWHAK